MLPSTPGPEPSTSTSHLDATPPSQRSNLGWLTLAALGVVYGDIGTSPLYALRESLAPEHGFPPSEANIFGVVSLIFWSLLLVISIKYLTFIVRAHNQGEGGILALMALVVGTRRAAPGGVLVLLGLFGAALLYSDGILTPAISVLSAVEGISIATPALEPFVVPLTMVILSVLFLAQRHGTSRVGAVFGPITLVWFVAIAALGVRGILGHPQILGAIDPRYGFSFLAQDHYRGFWVLGSVFLVVTGGEALYADMGHFGSRPIRLAWFCLALPSLLINYFGQGALLISSPEAIESPFFRLAPAWAMYPLVVLSTCATIIASQAVISGAFSLTQQAVQMGYLPRMEIQHTSPDEIGQVYVPFVNWALMIATLLVVFGFGTSARLASAYGVAVTSTMVITSLLFYLVSRRRWNWPPFAALALTAVFLVVDGSFFVANIIKVRDGGWLPLSIALAGFALMSTWHRGRQILTHRIQAGRTKLSEFIRWDKEHPLPRAKGTAVFLTADPEGTPSPLMHNLKHNKVLHEHVVVVTVAISEAPRVSSEQRVQIERLEAGFVRVQVSFGYMQRPQLWQALLDARDQLPEINPMQTTLFIGRTRPIGGKGREMKRWQERLFAALAKNAGDTSSYFGLPPNMVIEIGSQIEL
jgi:KUP system potassium uptake protein